MSDFILSFWLHNPHVTVNDFDANGNACPATTVSVVCPPLCVELLTECYSHERYDSNDIHIHTYKRMYMPWYILIRNTHTDDICVTFCIADRVEMVWHCVQTDNVTNQRPMEQVRKKKASMNYITKSEDLLCLLNANWQCNTLAQRIFFFFLFTTPIYRCLRR